jgi:hypothetical protein
MDPGLTAGPIHWQPFGPEGAAFHLLRVARSIRQFEIRDLATLNLESRISNL